MYDKVHSDIEDEDYYSRISDDVNRTFRKTKEEDKHRMWTAEDFKEHYQKSFEADCRLRGIPYPPEGLGEYTIPSDDSDDEYNLKKEFMKKGIDLSNVDENTKDFRIQMKVEYPGGDLKVRHWVLDDRALASEAADQDDFYARVTRPILENPPLNSDLKCMVEGIYKGNEHFFTNERFPDHPYFDYDK